MTGRSRASATVGAFFVAGLLVVGLHGSALACPRWDPWPPPQGNGIQCSGISTPANNEVFVVNSYVTCTIGTPTDQDHRHDDNGQPPDTLPYNQNWTYTWSDGGAGGTFLTNNATTVTYQTPETANASVTITCRVDDVDTIPPGETGSRHDGPKDFSVTIRVVEVHIIWNGQIVTRNTQDTVVGRNISLEGAVAPASITPTAHAWVVPEKKIANYTANESVGHVTQLEAADLTYPDVSFYWVDGADGRDVFYTATVGGKQLTVKTTFNVKRPECWSYATTGAVCKRAPQLSQVSLSFGTNDWQTPGIKFESTLNQAPGFPDGHWSWIQIVNSYSARREQAQAGGYWQHIYGGGE